MPLFSVIIPTFNRADLLAESLASVFAQRFRDFEVIVADDGSTDGTADALDSFAERIQVVRQENRGPGAARNRGAEVATGQYLAFLDSDDLWFPWTLDSYATAVLATPQPPAFIAGKPVVFRAQGELKTEVEMPTQATAFSDYYASGDEWRWYSASSFVIRADAFKEVGGFAPVWINGEDADLAMRLGTLGGFVQVAAPSTFGYRDHAGSLVSQAGRTLEGVQYALRMEQRQQYPGGVARARERRTILTRQFRPVMMTCLRERQFAAAWRLYLATWSWHLTLGRLRFLVGFPIQALLAVFRSQPRARAA